MHLEKIMATGTDVTVMLTEGVQECQPSILTQLCDDGYRGKKKKKKQLNLE